VRHLDLRIATLHAGRPRSIFLRVSLLALALLVTYAWVAGNFSFAELFSPRRMRNFSRFLTDVSPHGADGAVLPVSEWAAWAAALLRDNGREAMAITLAMSVAAIVLAWPVSLALCLPAARTIANPEPFLPGPKAPGKRVRLAWRTLSGTTRLVLILLRALPEYVWTYLLLGMLGISAWPAVLALAIHNAGILGKLNAEVVENLGQHRLGTLRGAGATRLQIAAYGVYPSALGRFLLYFFYRWETCVREATVLGMLGIVSLGRLITDSRVRFREDEMLFYVLLGAVLILVGDLVSALARGLVRRAA